MSRIRSIIQAKLESKSNAQTCIYHERSSKMTGFNKPFSLPFIYQELYWKLQSQPSNGTKNRMWSSSWEERKWKG
jgi:hypothetical protein